MSRIEETPNLKKTLLASAQEQRYPRNENYFDEARHYEFVVSECLSCPPGVDPAVGVSLGLQAAKVPLE